MVYDFEDGDHGPPQVSTGAYHSSDLESLVTVLTVAAICLSPEPNSKFTLQDLLGEARKLDPNLDDRDALIVLGHMPSLKRSGTKLRLT